jgi:hypothetical protein
MLCDLDESKGLDIGTQYRTDKSDIFFSIIRIQTSLHGLKNENKTKSNEF